MPQQSAERVDQRPPIVLGRDVQRAMVLVAAAAGQRIRDAGDCSLQLSDPLSAGHLGGHKAVRGR